jgi:hypothetical protein
LRLIPRHARAGVAAIDSKRDHGYAYADDMGRTLRLLLIILVGIVCVALSVIFPVAIIGIAVKGIAVKGVDLYIPLGVAGSSLLTLFVSASARFFMVRRSDLRTVSTTSPQDQQKDSESHAVLLQRLQQGDDKYSRAGLALVNYQLHSLYSSLGPPSGGDADD